MDKILLEVDIDDKDVTAAITEIQKATEAINQLKTANKELAEQGKTNSAQFIKNNEDIKTLNKTVGDNSRVVQANNQLQKAAKDSIDGLRAANALLLKEKNSLSTSDEASKKRIAEINALYDKNNKTIAENSSQTEKQKFNIGNYKSALDGLVPGLGGMTEGIEKATAASRTFIATPIGLVIAALGLAIGAVTAYFKSSEEAEGKLTVITKVLGAVFEQLMNFAEDLGGAIVSIFENPKAALLAFVDLLKQNVINRFEGMMELIPELGKAINLLFKGEFSAAGEVAANAVLKVATGVENSVGKIKGFINDVGTAVELGITNGKKLADIQEQIDHKQRDLITERAKIDLEVSKLREKSIAEEGDLKRKTIQEAIDLEKKLSDQEVILSALKRDQAALELANNGPTREAKDKLAQANADLIAAEASRFQATLRFQKELEALNNKEAADKEKEVARQKQINEDTTKSIEDAFKQQLTALDDYNKNRVDGMKAAEDILIQIIQDSAQAEINIQKQKLLDGTISQSEYNKEIDDLSIAGMTAELELRKSLGENTVQIEGQILDARLEIVDKETAARQKAAQTVSNILGQTASLFAKNTVAYKVLASAQAIVNTYLAATQALTAGPIVGPILAALTVVQGLLSVAKINAVNVPSFEEGGIVPISGKSHTQGGEDVAIGGKTVANVQSGEHLVVLKRGAHHIFNQLSRANELAGGVAFASDRAPRRYLADGGFVSRAASQGQQSLEQLATSFGKSISELKIYTRTTELAKVQKNVADVKIISELR